MKSHDYAIYIVKELVPNKKIGKYPMREKLGVKIFLWWGCYAQAQAKGQHNH